MPSRRLLVSLLLVLLAAPLVAPATASAHDTRWFFFGMWSHQHTRDWDVHIANGGAAVPLWATAPVREWGDETILTTRTGVGHWNSDVSINIADYGNTNWAGLADGCFHCAENDDHSHSYINMYHLNGRTYTYKRAVVCQEFGHNLGLGHAPGDCMGAGYYAEWTGGAGRHSTDLLNWAYRVDLGL